MADKVQKKVYLSKSIAELLDAHPRTNSDVATSALKAYLRSGELEEVDRRLDELQRRESVVKDERNERERELERIAEQRDSLKKQRERIEEVQQSEQKQLERIIEELVESNVPRDPDNEAIQNSAKKLDMTPEELLDELPDNNGGDLRSL
jgi:chromosome segregation ATPase